ncbi:MarR family winged helix-turn-helix transcriptional regulator [Hirschia litorea]|uniref:MarR family winged helix-turn-helix transcriptional regulator n=1 Tax=Hirschia litorea TaxID=1199156 RepID=A0ABW2ILY4_9PROT
MGNTKALDLAKLLEATARAVYDVRGPQHMHPGQWSVLRFLAGATENLRDVNGVAAHLGVTQGPASRAIATLEMKGFAVGVVQENDRRKRRIHLTQAGQDLLKEDPILRLKNAIEGLDSEAQNTLAAAMAEIYKDLNK